jgi:hypothetical protein
MMPRTTLLAAIALVFSVMSALAQDNSPQRQMAEDVEIMRRLLLQKLGIHAHGYFTPATNYSMGGGLGAGGFGFGTGGMPGGGLGMGGMPGGGMGMSSSSSGGMLGSTTTATGGMYGGSGFINYGPTGFIEGAYLRDYGVVFSVEVSSVPHDSNDLTVRPPQPSAKTSDWEEVQRQLRGQKPAKKPSPKVTPTVTELILKTLADNGKHFTQLKPEEMLTIIVTFRGGLARSGGTSTTAYQDLTAEAGLGAPGAAPAVGAGTGRGGPGGAGGSGGPPMAGPGGTGPGGGFGGGGRSRSQASSAEDLELLADLQLKQGKASEAALVLKKVLEREKATGNRLRLYRKLAQAYLASDQEAAAEKTLQTLLELRKKTPGSGGGPGKQPPASPPPVPPQLIISARKALLDQVGGGHMSREEFYRTVTIHRRGWPTKQE